MKRYEIFQMIDDERTAQNDKWGFPQKNTLAEWGVIIAEECGELMKEICDVNFSRGDAENMVTEAIQTAAVCVSFLEHVYAENGIVEKGETNE